MVAMMSWSMSWSHYSGVDGEVRGGGGLLSSCRAATSVVTVPKAGDEVAAALVVRWCCGAAMPTAGTTQLPTHQDRPILEWEVASPPVSRS
jgi:hypothetical protein